MSGVVSLRAVRHSDLESFFQDQIDPDAARMAAFPSRDREAFFAHWEKILSGSSGILRTVLLDSAVAGNVVSWEQDGQHMVGYWIGRAYWGKGVATAALTQFLTTVRVRPLVAHVAKHNIGSIRVLEKCGFTLTGEETLALPDGQVVDDLVMTLSADEHQRPGTLGGCR